MPKIGYAGSHHWINERFGTWRTGEVLLAADSLCRAVTRWPPDWPLAKSHSRIWQLRPATWKPSMWEPLALSDADCCQQDRGGLVRQQDQTHSRGLLSRTRLESVQSRNPRPPRAGSSGSADFVPIREGI